MTTKLTLTIEENVIKTAKSFAKQKGSSLSELIENYLKTLTLTDESAEVLTPKVQRLVGALKSFKEDDYKKVVAEEIVRKHSK